MDNANIYNKIGMWFYVNFSLKTHITKNGVQTVEPCYFWHHSRNGSVMSHPNNKQLPMSHNIPLLSQGCAPVAPSQSELVYQGSGSIIVQPNF